MKGTGMRGDAMLLIGLSSGHRRRREGETEAWGVSGFWTVFCLHQACARTQNNYSGEIGISGKADEG